MSEEELLKKYACNSLASFIDGYLTCEVAYDLLRSQFREIERLNAKLKLYKDNDEYLNSQLEKRDNIIKEVREYIEENSVYYPTSDGCQWVDQFKLLEILDKVEENK